MKSTKLISCVLALSVLASTPTVVFAHVGHGDEFQAEGGIDRVPVNAETDAVMGIEVTPIAAGATVLIPATALVEDNGRQLVFVQYENFYEPVPVTTGATQGELIEVTEGLSAGEQLVTQGSLSLYAESRKTQTAETETPTEPVAEAQPDITPAPAANAPVESTAVAQQPAELAEPSAGFPLGIVAAIGGVVLGVFGAMTFLGGRKQKRVAGGQKGSK
ncbi:cobalt transporter [Spirulina sp. CCNP1310]|uniref:cobalt transporter n=1 Tax=Spirulina sp. CCNP1310 TaxID=3110249 RepID=UPI002B1F8E6B|nr:cobalt transporter [Spirulina sp. CCNP1310]